MRVLVVDDEHDIKLLFEQYFRKEIKNQEIKLTYAFSGEEALNCLNDTSYHAILILSDINMPGMSGLKLLENIKSNHVSSSTYVVMITSYGDEENYRYAVEIGADDFITKPVDFHELKYKLKNLP
ncbi:MAG TPA: response regulator [Saprospiraceae bacterium]|nr:response regulator [Saprospiraceae bacterium]